MSKQLTKTWSEYPYKQLTNVDLEKHNIPWFSDNKVPQLKDGVYIVNKNNQHWYLVAVQHPEIFCYCSYGAETKYKDRPSNAIARSAKGQGFTTIYTNDEATQPPKSYLCGYMSLVIRDKLLPHIGKLNWDKFRDIVHQTYTTKPSDYNVKKTDAFCKKNGYY